MSKTCRRCKTDKPSTEFQSDRRNRDGLQAYCKQCFLEYQRERRANPSEADLRMKKKHQDRYYANHGEKIRMKNSDRKLQSRYGITRDEYNQMALDQEGKCAICGTDEPGGRGNTLHVDHDHETGQVRGLLCWTCNRRLGVLDNESFMVSAMKYLGREQ